MKQAILSFILVICFGLGLNQSAAQSKTDVYKQRQEQIKQKRKMLNEKASKDAKKEAKDLIKQGWKVAPGTLPMEKQLDRLYLLREDIDDEGYPSYVFGTAQSTGGNYDAAKMQATALAKQDLAGQIETSVGALIDNNIETKQLDGGDAVSITRSLSAGKQLIQNKLGRVIPVLEIYRETGKGREVRVTIAYNFNMAKTIAKSTIQQDLESRGDSLSKKLDTILGW